MEERVSKRERLLSLVFPAHCVLCGKLTEGGRRLCPECSRNPAPESVYRKLGNRYESHSLLCVAACSYAGEAKQLVLGLKFGGKKKNARILADKLLLALPKEWQYADVICWVPVSPQRKKERGYDQSELIARRIGRKTGCPCRPLLRKVRENRVQHELSAEERWVNVLGVYQADQKKIRDKRVLLIDDIVTTGATMLECAETLLRAGAEKVFCGAAETSIFTFHEHHNRKSQPNKGGNHEPVTGNSGSADSGRAGAGDSEQAQTEKPALPESGHPPACTGLSGRAAGGEADVSR